ncbi:AbaSI family restriction endonuclease [Microbacterium foliorum]|uniref:AbaSI family restriction endonuclease n=1 Tax=Microbacterium foliorum TaxID=104336 RepID=UPI001DB1D089|nr:hypothetical protein [Microbacterium foliorum]CAH0123964.1 hypothetical protein SRABI03_00053 [Microbacterium foliorum]CAH0130506.1 hypothetical protein SRABI44_00224 [Microbacterium foliorum]
MSTTIDDSVQASAEEDASKATRTPWTMPTEVDYYGRMLRSVRGKKYEVYAVSRILHLLDDPEIEIVTQKPIRKPDGSMALLDLYLPQFKVGVEIDEGHHFAKGSPEADKLREQAVLEASDIKPLVHLEVPSTDPLSTLKEKTDTLIADIRRWKADAISTDTFTPYNYGDRYVPEYWRARGKVTVDDDIQMPRMRQVLALFGKKVDHWQMGTYSLGENFQVWMPGLDQEKVTPRKDWKNVLSDDGETLTQTQLVDGDFAHNDQMRNVVFAKFKDPVFLDTYYRFLGVFAVEGIDDTGKIVTFRREATEIDLTPFLE